MPDVTPDSAQPTVTALAGPAAPALLAALRRDQGPVARVADLDAWLVLDHATAVAVARDPATFTVADPRFSTGRVVGPSMLSLDGAEHRRHRRPFAAPYRPARVQERYGATTAASAQGLLDVVRGAGRAELRADLAGPLSVTVMAQVLDLEGVDVTTVLRWYAALVAAVSSLSAAEPPSDEAASAMADLTAEVARRTRPGSVLASAAEHLDEREVASNAAVMLFGGIETTEGMILNALAGVLADPELTAAVRSSPDLADAAVEESLRLEPAAAVVDRYATRDVVLGDAEVRAGDLVRVSLTAANRDPAVFADPDRFDPRRPRLREHLAFATGPHACLAADLARLETRAALDAVLALPDVRLVAPVAATGLVFRKPGRLEVRWGAPH